MPAWNPAEALPRHVRVVRDWPGGPPPGTVIAPPAWRCERLLRLGVVEPAEEPIAPPRRRGTPHRPEQAETDLLEQRSTRG